MDESSWIAGLMRENSDALGFIPLPTLTARYVRLGRYVFQRDERGRAVGYALHGAIMAGRVVSIAQHCIQHEHRLRGYGEAAFMELRRRAEYGGASAITLRCGIDLEALAFWRAQGFVLRDIVPGGMRRERQIARMYLPLRLPLFDGLSRPGG